MLGNRFGTTSVLQECIVCTRFNLQRCTRKKKFLSLTFSVVTEFEKFRPPISRISTKPYRKRTVLILVLVCYIVGIKLCTTSYNIINSISVELNNSVHETKGVIYICARFTRKVRVSRHLCEGRPGALAPQPVWP